jgi:hypothetical protein
MNVLRLSSGVRVAHMACYWKFFLLRYTQVLCQYRLCRADHAYLTCLLFHKSKSKSCYDRRSAGQFVLVSSTHLVLTTRFLLLSDSCGLFIWGAHSDERTGLPFTTAAGPRQRSHFWVWVPRDSWPYFTVLDSRLSQPGGPGPRIYILQEQGGPVIPSSTGFPFRRVQRLAGLRWT